MNSSKTSLHAYVLKQVLGIFKPLFSCSKHFLEPASQSFFLSSNLLLLYIQISAKGKQKKMLFFMHMEKCLCIRIRAFGGARRLLDK